MQTSLSFLWREQWSPAPVDRGRVRQTSGVCDSTLLQKDPHVGFRRQVQVSQMLLDVGTILCVLSACSLTTSLPRH